MHPAHLVSALARAAWRPVIRRALPLAGLALCGVPAGAQLSTTPDGAPVVDEALADRVRSFVSQSVQAPMAGARVSFEVGKLDPRLRLAPCRRIDTQLPPAGTLWGRTRIALKCVEGERLWQVWLPVTVKVLAPALTPVRALPAGTVLGAEHLQVAEVDWAADATQGPGMATAFVPPFTQTAPVLGRTLVRAVQPGQALRATDLRQRQFFASGDTVTLVARGDGFAVSGEGQALAAGLEGQTVRVRTESGRVLTGTAVSAHRVEVAL